MEHLVKDGYRVVKVEYPDYKSDSSALVKMYLGGEFGEHAEDVDAYGASTFFAVDRYASFHLNWKQAYEEGAIILADRYTTSNMVHQAVKLTDPIEREEFLTWLWDFEFEKLGLPVPDFTVFLEVPVEESLRLIEVRGEKKDIHENRAHLEKAYRAAVETALGDEYWTVYETWNPRRHLVIETQLEPGAVLPILATFSFNEQE
jgi:dTMP kinase